MRLASERSLVPVGDWTLPHVQTLDPGVSWVPGRTEKACIYDQFCEPKLVAGRLYASRGDEMAYE